MRSESNAQLSGVEQCFETLRKHLPAIWSTKSVLKSVGRETFPPFDWIPVWWCVLCSCWEVQQCFIFWLWRGNTHTHTHIVSQNRTRSSHLSAARSSRLTALRRDVVVFWCAQFFWKRIAKNSSPPPVRWCAVWLCWCVVVVVVKSQPELPTPRCKCVTLRRSSCGAD